jgi:hypothetical protein
MFNLSPFVLKKLNDFPKISAGSMLPEQRQFGRVNNILQHSARADLDLLL